jgi:hypothetical protein
MIAHKISEQQTVPRTIDLMPGMFLRNKAHNYVYLVVKASDEPRYRFVNLGDGWIYSFSLAEMTTQYYEVLTQTGPIPLEWSR